MRFNTSFLLHIAFSLSLSTLSLSCVTSPSNTSLPPSVICSARVSVERIRNCSLLIVENVTYPFSFTQTPLKRYLPLLSSQDILNATVSVRGQMTPIELLNRENGTYPVEITTITSRRPVAYVLTYVLQGGAMTTRQEGCGVVPNADIPTEGNIWRWASGNWGAEQGARDVRVKFIRTSGGNLSLIGNEYESEERNNGNIVVDIGDTDEEVQIAVSEPNPRNCAVEFQCLSEAQVVETGNEEGEENNNGWFSEWWHYFAVGAGAALLISCILGGISKLCDCGSSSGTRRYTVGAFASDTGVGGSHILEQGQERDREVAEDMRRRYYLSEEERKRKERQRASEKRRREEMMNQQRLRQQMMQRRQQEEARRAAARR